MLNGIKDNRQTAAVSRIHSGGHCLWLHFVRDYIILVTVKLPTA